MKTPHTYSLDEEDLSTLVLAAESEDFAAACDILFVHERDLNWGGTPALVELEINPEFAGEFQQARQLIKTRVEQSMIGLVRNLMPLVREARAIVPENTPDGKAQEQRIVQAIANYFNSTGVLEHFGELLLGNAQFAADCVAETAIASATIFYERVLRATGFATDEYTDMLAALKRLDLLSGPLVQIAIPNEGLWPELSFAGPKGFQAIEISEEAHVLAIYGLDPRLRRHKKGQETALSIFIAAYLNRRSITPEPAAYACARYGAKSDGELDVVIPYLGAAMEVKLYESPATLQGEHRLRPHARRLEEQLATYAKARTKQMFFVTNLPHAIAVELLGLINPAVLSGMTISPLCGTQSLLERLRQFTTEISEQASKPRAAAKRAGK